MLSKSKKGTQIKGQSISEWIYEVIVSPKVRTKKIYALCSEDRNNFLFVIWKKRWLHKFILKLTFSGTFLQQVPTAGMTCATPSDSEIICGQNVGTKVVCGMILFFEKKAMLKIWKKSWVPFRSYLLDSTANPAHLHSNWAGLAVLFSR